MQGLLRLFSPVVLWSLFFLTDLYGHVTLKMTLGRESSFPETARRLLGSWMGWSIFLAWGLAGLLWVCVLSKNTLFQTNSISMLNYILICLAAVCFLGENPSPAQWGGMGLIGIGVYLTGK
jgi:drug/metabolite transporter (DMT)-like permease